MSENRKKNMKNIAIFVVIMIFAILCLYFIAYEQLFALNNQYSKSLSDEKTSKINGQLNNIQNGTVVQKYFKGKMDNLDKIIISFAKSNALATANIKVNIKLEDLQNNKIIKEDTISYNMIRSDNDYDFIFDTQKSSKGKQYRITINFEKVEKVNLDIKYTNQLLQNDSEIRVNGKTIEGTLAINEYYISSSKITKFNIIFIGIATIVVVISIVIFTRKKITPEKMFILTVPLISLIFLFVMPMYRGHDEIRHMLRAYELSEGHLLTEINDKKIGTPMPKSIVEGVGKNWREKLTYNDLIQLKDKELQPEIKAVGAMENVAIYSPIQYIPQAIGMFFSRIISENMLLLLYMARLFNLVVCMLLLYFAIRIIPFGKMIIYIISVLPLSLEAFATMSPDGITISVSLLFIAYILKIICSKNKLVTKKDIVLLSIMAIVIALCKIVYLPLVGLVLLIPTGRFKNRRERVLTNILIMFLAIVANLAWLIISSKYLALGTGGDATEKVKLILSSPIAYIRMLLYTMNYSGYGYIQTLFGSVLAMGEFVKLYFIVPFTYMILFMFEAITNNENKNKFNLFQTVIIFLIILAIVGLIFTSLYVQYTNLNSNVIQGVQGRYFIPILFLIAMLLAKVKVINNCDEVLKIKFIGIISLVLQVYIMLAIIIVHI